MKVETAYMETSNGVNPDLGQICDGLIKGRVGNRGGFL